MFYKALIAVCSIGIILLGLQFFGSSYSVGTPNTNPPSPIPPEKIDYSTIPLKERVGQLFMIGHWSEFSATTTAERIGTYSLGGVIVMDAPASTTDISLWTASWQAVASTSPLIIGIDQEGGSVSRLKEERFVQLAQPDITSEKQAYAVSEERGRALRTLGINTNFAPVLDTSVSSSSFLYTRVFRGADMVAPYGSAMVRGYSAAQVLAAPKHYPGHPDTADDSHEVLPVLALTTAEYETRTTPFAAVIHNAAPPLLMTAHVSVPALDTSYPATLSPAVLKDLRNRLHYQGVVITDDLAMQAISDRWSASEGAILALQAGADMILLAAEPETVAMVIPAVLQAIERGDISEARINEAYARIQTSKALLR